MTDQPKVSIITVSYNAEDYIERTIKSVIEQTYPNIEYIVIDGKSKDSTMEIIDKYKDKIDYLLSEPDKSHFEAMNKGLRAATGDYIWYMNAGDCIYESTTLEKAMKDADNSDFIYGETLIIDEEDGSTRPWHKQTPPPDKLSAKSFINGMVICHHSMIIKRNIAPEYDYTWHISNDIDWAIRILKKAKTVHYVNEIMCLYLEGGISKDNIVKSVKERFAITRKHFGVMAVLLEQPKVLWQLVMRGRLN